MRITIDDIRNSIEILDGENEGAEISMYREIYKFNDLVALILSPSQIQKYYGDAGRSFVISKKSEKILLTYINN